MIEHLPAAAGFAGTFFKCADLPRVPAEPLEDDFDNLADYERSYDDYVAHQFDPKPWSLTSTSADHCLEVLRSAMNWSINNKTYFVGKGTPSERQVAFSRDPDEKTEIAQQEADHQKHVQRFMVGMESLISGEQCWLHETNHVLDTLNPPSKNAAEAFEWCFYDRLLVVTTRSSIVMIWIGHLRWYG